MNSPFQLLQPACLEQVSAACTASVTECTASVTECTVSVTQCTASVTQCTAPVTQCTAPVTQAHTLQDEFPFQTVTIGMPRASFASLLCLGHLTSHAYLDL